MAKVNLITQAAYAKHRGVSGAAVNKAVKENRISLIDGKIDPVVADMQWEANSRVPVSVAQPGQHAPLPIEPVSANVFPPLDDVPVPKAEPKPGNEGYLDARAKRERADSEMAEMALAERKGELIQVKAVEAIWSQALAGVREHLLQLRSRLSPLLAAEGDEYQVSLLLETEHRQALEFLSRAALGKGEGNA